MLRKIASAVAVLLCFPLSCLSASEPPKLDGWTLLATSDYAFVYAKNDSAYVNQGVRYILIQGIPTSRNLNHTVSYFRVGISNVDCRNEMGSLMFYNIQGQYLQRGDYVKGGGSVGSIISDLLCSLEHLRVK